MRALSSVPMITRASEPPMKVLRSTDFLDTRCDNLVVCSVVLAGPERDSKCLLGTVSAMVGLPVLRIRTDCTYKPYNAVDRSACQAGVNQSTPSASRCESVLISSLPSTNGADVSQIFPHAPRQFVG